MPVEKARIIIFDSRLYYFKDAAVTNASFVNAIMLHLKILPFILVA